MEGWRVSPKPSSCSSVCVCRGGEWHTSLLGQVDVAMILAFVAIEELDEFGEELGGRTMSAMCECAGGQVEGGYNLPRRW